MSATRLTVSVVIPAYNEQAALPLLRERLTRVIDALTDYDFEILVVDDHSTDATTTLLEEWSRAEPRLRSIRLAHNCGSHAASTAGLLHCGGNCAVLMAADLEDPPELIAELLDRWQAGQDVVWAIRGGTRGVNWRVRLISRLYWGLMRRIAVPETPPHGADAVLLDRRVLEGLRQVGEKNTSLISLLMWMGFRQTQISYQKGERVGGHSGWTLSKRIKLAIDSVVSFSALPIRLTWLAGLLHLATATVWTVAVLVGWLTDWFYVGRAVAVIVGLLLLGFGLGLACLGAIGEYVWRIYDETRRRPRYLIERTIPGSASRFVAHPQEVELHAEATEAHRSPRAQTGAELRV